jgi:DNA-binding CsgD family transcriptional regulator
MTGDVATREDRESMRPRAETSRSPGSGREGWSSSPGSMTRALAELRSVDPVVRNDAAQRLWERFAPGLCDLARSRLNPRIRVREDENDIVQGLFRHFFEAQQNDRYALRSREELWRLLVRMTLCMVANASHYHQRICRDVRRERSPASSSPMPENADDRAAGHLPFRALSPEEEAISRIELARILLLLDDRQRELIGWKLEGDTNAEIARKIRRTERTVELKMRLIREILVRDPGVSQELARESRREG